MVSYGCNRLADSCTAPIPQCIRFLSDGKDPRRLAVICPRSKQPIDSLRNTCSKKNKTISGKSNTRVKKSQELKKLWLQDYLPSYFPNHRKQFQNTMTWNTIQLPSSLPHPVGFTELKGCAISQSWLGHCRQAVTSFHDSGRDGSERAPVNLCLQVCHGDPGGAAPHSASCPMCGCSRNWGLGGEWLRACLGRRREERAPAQEWGLVWAALEQG